MGEEVRPGSFLSWLEKHGSVRRYPKGAILWEQGASFDSVHLLRRGRVFLSNATITADFALRICVVNHRATRADLDDVISEVLSVGRELAK